MNFLIYCGHSDDEKSFYHQIEEKLHFFFPQGRIIREDNLGALFTLFKEEKIEVLLFPTFQTTPRLGPHKDDLSALLYFAASEDSFYSQTLFIPLDPVTETKDLEEGQFLASDYYQELFYHNIFLQQGVPLNLLSKGHLMPDQALSFLKTLTHTVSEAFDEFDQKLPSCPPEETSPHVKVQYPSKESEYVQIVKGKREEDADWIKVKGTAEEKEEVTKIKSHVENEDDIIKVKGYEEEEDDQKAFHISGQRKEAEEVFKVSGSSQPEEDNTIIRVKGSSEKEDLTSMKVKSLNPHENVDSLKKGEQIDLNQRNKWGQTLLMVYAQKGEIDKVKNLLKSGANPGLQCKEGKSLLHYASRNNDNKGFIFQLIDQHQQKLAKRDAQGFDPFYEAVKFNADQIVKEYIELGARLNLKVGGQTYLHVALESNALESFQTLLNYGADPLAKNQLGTNVIQVAKKKKMVPYLLALKESIEANKGKKNSSSRS